MHSTKRSTGTELKFGPGYPEVSASGGSKTIRHDEHYLNAPGTDEIYKALR